MPISYNKLWKLLIDKSIKKMEFKELVKISNGTLAKLSKQEPVALTVLEKICNALDCEIGDIMEFIPERQSHPLQKYDSKPII